MYQGRDPIHLWASSLLISCSPGRVFRESSRVAPKVSGELGVTMKAANACQENTGWIKAFRKRGKVLSTGFTIVMEADLFCPDVGCLRDDSW